MPDHTPLADQQLDDLHQHLTGPLGTATDVCGGTALRLVAEVLRGREALAREERLHGDTIDDRDRAQDMADKLAYAVAPETVIGEHTADNSPWANALELVTPKAEVDRLRNELAAFEMLAPQQCAAGKHADWLVDSEYAHACPWCQIEKLRAEQQPIALPARWECSHGPSDDEPFCAEAEDEGHVCPTIRVHPSDATAFAALVDEVHRLRADQQPPKDAEACRLALSEALHLGNGAPWDAILDRAGELSRRDVEASQSETPHGPDTLAAWLYSRFIDALDAPAWDLLPDADRAYWEHHAQAVRRAVARGGFKAAVEETHVVASDGADPETQAAPCGRLDSVPTPCSAGDHCCRGPLTDEELAVAQADVDALNAEFPDEPADGYGGIADRGWTA